MAVRRRNRLRNRRSFGESDALFSHVSEMTRSEEWFYSSALLLSFLTFPPLYGVRTIAELAAAVQAGQYQCATYPGSYLTPSLEGSSDRAARTIGRDLRTHPGTTDVLAFLRDHQRQTGKRPAFVGGSNDFAALKAQYFVSGDPFFPALVAIAVRKGFCCGDQLDRVIGRVAAAGLYDRIVLARGFRDSLETTPATDEVAGGSAERSLSLNEFKGAIIFLVSGYVLSSAVLLSEIMSGNVAAVVRLRKRRRAERSSKRNKPAGDNDKQMRDYLNSEQKLSGATLRGSRKCESSEAIGSEESMF